MKYKFKDKISIVIPTYNRASVIKTSIDSILKQTYDNIEIIVVDDASSDNTDEIVKRIKDERVKYIKLEKNSGACVARNVGIKESTGKYITFNDSDDEYYSEKLEKQYNNLIKNKSDMDFCRLKIYLSDFIIIMPAEECMDNIKKKKFVDELVKGNYISTQAIFVKREVILKYMFDKDLPRLQDYDLVLRMVPDIKVSYTDEVLVNLYNSKDSIGNSKEKLLNAMKIIINKNYNFTEEQSKNLKTYLINLYAYSAEREIEKEKTENNKLKYELRKIQQKYDSYVYESTKKMAEYEDYISNMINSKSWKITKPLRAFSGKNKK